METLQFLFPDKCNFDYHALARPRMCTDEICDALLQGKSLSQIAKKWKNAANEFMATRALSAIK